MRKIESRIIAAMKSSRPLRYKQTSADEGGPIYHDEVTHTNTRGTEYYLLGTRLAQIDPNGRLTIGIDSRNTWASSRTTKSRINALCHGFGVLIGYRVRTFEKGQYTL